MKSFVKVGHWKGYVTHIEDDHFCADVKWIPLNKKKAKLLKEEAEDGWVQFKKSEVPLKDQHEIKLGKIFDWYLGFTSKPYVKGRVDVSLIVWMKKYGPKGKRINMEKVKKLAKELYENLKWD